jgi:FdhD protein
VVSSCGVCGKQTIDEVLRSLPPLPAPGGAAPAPRNFVTPQAIVELPATLRHYQPVFGRTGALHAAGAFAPDGRALRVREDIGRHNAVDKVIGAFVREGSEHELRDCLLVVSGRVSFEVVQKALRARLPVVVSVSGVSTLATELAHRGGITLCGFTRKGTFSVYSHAGRIRGLG